MLFLQMSLLPTAKGDAGLYTDGAQSRDLTQGPNLGIYVLRMLRLFNRTFRIIRLTHHIDLGTYTDYSHILSRSYSHHQGDSRMQLNTVSKLCNAQAHTSQKRGTAHVANS
jgi:hypothetical protein